MQPSIPSQMKAAAIDRFGGPDVLHVEELPVPQPGEGEVLLRVDTAGVGAWDPWVREGGLGSGTTRFPFVMGNDGAGVVVATGPKVRKLKVGERAYGYRMAGGFYAEYAMLQEKDVAPIPPGVKAEEAGALGADGITALRGLDDQLQLRRGQSLMVYGAGGGVGHMAVQLAKRMGARVLAVASGSDGVELARRMGADSVVEGHHGEVARAAREFAPEGLDAALVLAHGKTLPPALACVKKGGRIAFPNGVEPEPEAPEGTTLLAYDGVPSAEAFERLNALIGKEPFHVELGRLYPLEDAARAHQDVTRHHLGKLALRIHPS